MSIMCQAFPKDLTKHQVEDMINCALAADPGFLDKLDKNVYQFSAVPGRLWLKTDLGRLRRHVESLWAMMPEPARKLFFVLYLNSAFGYVNNLIDYTSVEAGVKINAALLEKLNSTRKELLNTIAEQLGTEAEIAAYLEKFTRMQ